MQIVKEVDHLENTMWGFGAVCFVAAIVRGGLTVGGCKIPVIASTGQRWTLGIFGVVLMGLSLWLHLAIQGTGGTAVKPKFLARFSSI